LRCSLADSKYRNRSAIADALQRSVMAFSGHALQGQSASTISFTETMKHLVITWNRATREHFCMNCGRTSDAINAADAQERLEQYACKILSVEAPSGEPGMKTLRLNRKLDKRIPVVQ
jgi:hypothetical protein